LQQSSTRAKKGDGEDQPEVVPAYLDPSDYRPALLQKNKKQGPMNNETPTINLHSTPEVVPAYLNPLDYRPALS